MSVSTLGAKKEVNISDDSLLFSAVEQHAQGSIFFVASQLICVG